MKDNLSKAIFLKHETDETGYPIIGYEYVKQFHDNAKQAFPDNVIFSYFGFDIHVLEGTDLIKVESLEEIKDILNQKLEDIKVNSLKVEVSE
jgi:hypothetical protein